MWTQSPTGCSRTMDRDCNDHKVLIIRRNGEQSVVMLSLEDYQALEEPLRAPCGHKSRNNLVGAACIINELREAIKETAYLLSTPAKANRVGRTQAALSLLR